MSVYGVWYGCVCCFLLCGMWVCLGCSQCVANLPVVCQYKQLLGRIFWLISPHNYTLHDEVVQNQHLSPLLARENASESKCLPGSGPKQHTIQVHKKLKTGADTCGVYP